MNKRYIKSLYKVVNESTGASRGENGEVYIKDTSTFTGIRDSLVQETVGKMAAMVKGDIERSQGMMMDSIQSINQKVMNQMHNIAKDIVQGVPVSKINLSIPKGTPSASVMDSLVDGFTGGTSNSAWGIGNSFDPAMANFTQSNLWISPQEAQALYSQKGLLETVISKKAKSILLNGLKIKNPRLKADQLDRITEEALRLSVPGVISDHFVTSLVYGGGLLFPMFKKDNPRTMNQSLPVLLRAGVLGKDCISRFISLDRWNTWVVPPVSPCQKDYVYPENYFIPFLGTDVRGARCARVVPSKPAGWWGMMLTQGWGLSDFCGYYSSYEQYTIAKLTLPSLIAQMSILIRTMNFDSALAMGGQNAFDRELMENTIRFRRASSENPVSIDVYGDIKAINRNFSQVESILKLIRQAFAADTGGIPEPMLFSSEKGNFSSGDETQGNLTKQWEGIRYAHKEVENQCKNLAMLMVIHTLGTDSEILRALPYTTIQFDSPVIANATETSEISKNLSETFFNLVGGRVPMDEAMQIAFSYAGDNLTLSSETISRLKKIQERFDKQENARFDMEMEQGKVQAENVKSPVQSTQVKSGSKNSSKDKYTKLEQKQHEKTRVGGQKRQEGLAKAASKIKDGLYNLTKSLFNLEENVYGGDEDDISIDDNEVDLHKDTR